MKIEILYMEVANLFGDTFNVKYLQECLPNAQFIFTSLLDEEYFINHDVDMIYMGPSTEKYQEIIINKLMMHKDRIKELIEDNKVFLFTGNSCEILFDYIMDNDEKIEGLGLFNYYSVRNMKKRMNYVQLCKFNDIEIVGFKSQFTQYYTDKENDYLFDVIKGIGNNQESKFEGIKYNNFMSTSILGPILVLNPDFTKYILKLLTQDKIKLPNYESLKAAHDKRVEEINDKIKS